MDGAGSKQHTEDLKERAKSQKLYQTVLAVVDTVKELDSELQQMKNNDRKIDGKIAFEADKRLNPLIDELMN